MESQVKNIEKVFEELKEKGVKTGTQVNVSTNPFEEDAFNDAVPIDKVFDHINDFKR